MTKRPFVWLAARQAALIGVALLALAVSAVETVEVAVALGFCLIETAMLAWFGNRIRVAEAEEAATVESISTASVAGRPASAVLLRLLDSGAELVGSVAATGSNVLVIMGVAASASFLFWQLAGTNVDGVSAIDAGAILTVAPRSFFATAFAVLSGASLSMDGQAAQLNCRRALRALVEGAIGADEAGTEGAVRAGTKEMTRAVRAGTKEMAAALARLTRVAEATTNAVSGEETIAHRGRLVEVAASLGKIQFGLEAEARAAATLKPQADHHAALVGLASQQVARLDTMSASIGKLAIHVETLTLRLSELGTSFDSGMSGVRSAVVETGIDAKAIQSMQVAFAAAPSLAIAGTSLAADVAKLHSAMTRETAGLLEQHLDAIREQAQRVTETTMSAIVTAALGPMRDQVQTITGDVQQRIEGAFEGSRHQSEIQMSRYFTTVEERLAKTSEGIGRVTEAVDALNTGLGSVTVSVQRGASGLASQVPAYENAALRFGESAAKVVASLGDAARLAEADRPAALLESIGGVARTLQEVSNRMELVLKATEEHERRLGAARSRLADQLKRPLEVAPVASETTDPGRR